MSLYFKGNTFYEVKNRDSRLPDPEERLTEQVEQLSISLTNLWTALLRPAFDIGFNAVVIYRTVGGRALSSLVGYMSAATLILQYVVPNFRGNVRKQYKLEGRFRFVHTRLVNHTESIAFFGGDEVEKSVCNARFDRLKSHIEASQLESLRFNVANNFIVRQTPDLMAFAFRMWYAVGNFASDASVVSSGGGITSTGEYIQQTTMRTFRSFGDAFELSETIGNFVGTLESVHDAMLVLEDLSSREASAEARAKLQPSADGAVRFKGVDIVAPGGVCCARDLTFEVPKGSPLIVTGPNASGKSSLFRTLGGLWDIPVGAIERPCDASGKLTPAQVFLVPQRPYSVRGTLADQVTYPLKLSNRTPADEKKIMDLLALVEVAYLARDYDGDSGPTCPKVGRRSLPRRQQRTGCALIQHDLRTLSSTSAPLPSPSTSRRSCTSPRTHGASRLSPSRSASRWRSFILKSSASAMPMATTDGLSGTYDLTTILSYPFFTFFDKTILYTYSTAAAARAISISIIIITIIKLFTIICCLLFLLTLCCLISNLPCCPHNDVSSLLAAC